jgi:hypothetical protein
MLAVSSAIYNIQSTTTETELFCLLSYISLQMFLSAHYAGDDLSPKFTNGEYWKKVHGPVFMYLNSSWDGNDPIMLWEDAKVQVINFRPFKCLRIYYSILTHNRNT